MHNIVELLPRMKSAARRLENIAMSQYISGIQDKFSKHEKTFSSVRGVLTDVQAFQQELLLLSRVLLLPEIKAIYADAANGEGGRGRLEMICL